MPVVLAPIRPLLSKDIDNNKEIDNELTSLRSVEQTRLEESKQDSDYALVSAKDAEETPFIQLSLSQAETIG